VLQSVAVGVILQYVAVCCGVLRYIAVCCGFQADRGGAGKMLDTCNALCLVFIANNTERHTRTTGWDNVHLSKIRFP
jgi:hypothetical protein